MKRFALLLSVISLFVPLASMHAADPKSNSTLPKNVPVRVMSFNIRYATAPDGENHWDKRKAFLAETIGTFDPDLLGTQETLAVQKEFLSQTLQGYEAFGVGREDGQNQGEMAALFYRKVRFEKLDGGHFWLSETPDQVGSKGWDAALPRLATWVKLKDRLAVDTKPLFFLNTHFDHRGTKARQQAAQLIRKKVTELGKDCRCIITGDFNAAEGSEPYKALFDKIDDTASPLIDSFRTLHPNRGQDEGTFSGFKAAQTRGERIDWIACTNDWEVRLAGMDRTSKEGRTPSDHFPVTAVLRPILADQKPNLRVLCYNIHHGEGVDGKVDLLRLAKVIRSVDPDLVALQEVDNKTKRTGGVDQTAELARFTGLYGHFGKAIDYQGGEYGQAILSRFPIRTPVVHTLPGMPEREQRIALEVTLSLQGQEVSFITTHLHHQEEALREQQATKLNELFTRTDRPILLAGDLNATPESKPLTILKTKWTLASAGADLFTFPVAKPTKQIDFLLFRPSGSFRVVENKVLDEAIASDHRAIFTVLEGPAK